MFHFHSQSIQHIPTDPLLSDLAGHSPTVTQPWQDIWGFWPCKLTAAEILDVQRSRMRKQNLRHLFLLS